MGRYQGQIIKKNDTLKEGKIINETKYNKYVMLYNRLKKVGLDTLSFRPQYFYD